MPTVEVTVNDTAPPRSNSGSTGNAFIVGTSQRGPTTPRFIQSMTAFVTTFGGRVNNGTLYDAAKQFFQTGGSGAWIQRKTPAAAVAATLALPATTPILNLVANSVGTWGNGLGARIVAGAEANTYQLDVAFNGTRVEISPPLADKAALAAWASSSSAWFGSATVGAGTLAVQSSYVAATGGVDSYETLTNSDRDAALAKFTKSMGSGQVYEPGATTTAAWASLTQHAIDTNRIALLLVPDTGDKATLKTGVNYIRSNFGLTGQRHAAFFGGAYPIIPGDTVGSRLPADPLSVVAGLMARGDRDGGPNVAAAGLKGIVDYAVDLTREFSDADYEELNAAGVNLFRNVQGSIRLMGYRTAADKNTYPLWWQLGNARLLMYIIESLSRIGDDFLFAQLDGQDMTISKFEGRQIGFLQETWLDGALYGETSAEAFFVDVGAQVNTPATLANGELRSVVTLKMSPMAEDVRITIVKKQITEEL